MLKKKTRIDGTMRAIKTWCVAGGGTATGHGVRRKRFSVTSRILLPGILALLLPALAVTPAAAQGCFANLSFAWENNQNIGVSLGDGGPTDPNPPTVDLIIFNVGPLPIEYKEFGEVIASPGTECVPPFDVDPGCVSSFEFFPSCTDTSVPDCLPDRGIAYPPDIGLPIGAVFSDSV